MVFDVKFPAKSDPAVRKSYRFIVIFITIIFIFINLMMSFAFSVWLNAFLPLRVQILESILCNQKRYK